MVLIKLKKRFDHWTPRYIIYRLLLFFNERIHPDWPWLTKDAVKILDKLLTKEMCGLEFGSGRSTVWFAKRVKKLISIEDNQHWFTKVKWMLGEDGVTNVDLYLKTEADYTDIFEKIENGSLDFILVDGVLRDVCVKKSIPKLKTGGILIIDNANWFLPSLSRSPNSRRNDFETDIWKEVFEELKTWKKIWTTNGVTDTLILFKP